MTISRLIATLFACFVVFATSMASTPVLQKEKLFDNSQLDDAGVSLKADKSGNAWVWYATTDQNTAVTTFRLSKLSSIMHVTPIATKTFAYGATDGDLWIAPTSDQSIYVFAHYSSATGANCVYMAKYSYAGALLWSHSYTSSYGDEYLIGEDLFGTTPMIALSHSYATGKNEFYSTPISLSTGNPTGTAVKNADISSAVLIMEAFHVGHVWYVSGSDPAYPANPGVRKWGEYSDSTGQDFFHQDFHNTAPTATVAGTSYFLVPAVQTNGDVFVAVSSQNRSNNTSSATVSAKHVIAAYNDQGTHLWTSSSFPGICLQMVSSSPTTPVYDDLQVVSGKISAPKFTPEVREVTHTASTATSVWVKAQDAVGLLLDSTGYYAFYSNPTTMNVEVNRFDLAGALRWQIAWKGNAPNPFPGQNIIFGFAPISGGFYVGASVTNATTGLDTDVRRYN